MLFFWTILRGSNPHVAKKSKRLLIGRPGIEHDFGNSLRGCVLFNVAHQGGCYAFPPST